MSATYVQDNLKLKISTPLGPNKLLLRSFRGEERISGLFQFTLEMVSEDNAIDFQAIVGKPVTISLHLGNHTEHYLNGIVERLLQEETDLRLQFRSGRNEPACDALLRRDSAVALAADENERLPCLSKQDGARHYRERL